MTIKVLILGGTSEGRLLAERLADDARFDVLLSFAGRTENLQRPELPHRVGGFGGAQGLASFLLDGGYQTLVDATHPFAAQISANAVDAAAQSGVPLLRLMRPAWQKQEGDNWLEVRDMAQAVLALGTEPRRVFLTVGKLELPAFESAPQHTYLVRTIDTLTLRLPHARLLTARGPFALADELALLERERIELLVSKNAGTKATYAKLEAARQLGIPVIMVARPTLPAAAEVSTLAEVEAWLASHVQLPSRRGE